jgi:hypothetical protein
MSLLTIRQKCLTRTGSNKDASSNDFALLNRLINDAAEEVYRSDDLNGALKEELIAIPSVNSKMLAFPAYMFEIRAMRWYDSMTIIKLRTIHARFQNDNYGIKLEDWRDIGYSPLQQQITNASTLKFTIPLAELSDIKISVVGKTPNSSRIEEIVTIATGSLEVETVNDFEEVVSITKSRVTNYNITVEDAEENELALIPNNELQSRYKIVQIRDDKFSGQQENCGIEVLYKEKFVPMVNNSDTFLDGSYDEAIYWKFLEYWYSTHEGKAQEALMSMQKSAEIVEQVRNNANLNKDMQIQFGENRFYNMFGRSYTPY